MSVSEPVSESVTVSVSVPAPVPVPAPVSVSVPMPVSLCLCLNQWLNLFLSLFLGVCACVCVYACVCVCVCAFVPLCSSLSCEMKAVEHNRSTANIFSNVRSPKYCYRSRKFSTTRGTLHSRGTFPLTFRHSLSTSHFDVSFFYLYCVIPHFPPSSMPFCFFSQARSGGQLPPGMRSMCWPL
jgi:hypothetical protein